MSASLEVLEETDSVLLGLPPRNLRHLANVGFSTIVVAAIFAGIIYAQMMWIAPQPVQPGFGDFVICEVVAGIGLILIAIAFVGSRTEVRVGQRDIQITEYFGRLSWVRRCPLDRVRRFAIRHLFAQARHQSAPPPTPEDLALLVIECRHLPEVKFAHGYRRKQLLELANELAARCGELVEAGPQSQPIEVVEQDEATLFEERDVQPDESLVVCEEHADGVTLQVPPNGFWRCFGPTLFAAIPLLIMLCFRLWMICQAWPNPDPIDCVAAGVSLLILLALALHARARSRRRSVLAVVADRLLVIEAAFFRNRRHEYDRADLYDIRSGKPPTESRGEIFELQIWLRDGRKLPLLKGRPAPELQWMATVLRRTLRLPLRREEIEEVEVAMEVS